MRKLSLLVVILTVMALVAGIVFAASGPKIHKVTGPVLSVTNDLIVIQKGKKDKWEIIRNADTQVTGDLKVGAKVTIQYKMIATAVEVKAKGK
jgi:hypothetical protein